MAGLVACGGGDTSADTPARTPTSSVTPPASGVTTTSPSPTDEDGSPSSTPPSSTSPFASAAVLSESLRFGSLQVRAISYDRSGVGGAANGTRLDVVTVEECASGATAQVQHRTWHLVSADGRTLGVAGGKVVDGHPTEDLPRTLYAGQCLQTKLAIGVPVGSTPVAVMDGPSNTWTLDD